MSIQWRAADGIHDMFPIKYTETNGNKMFMTPIYKEGASAFAFPGNGHDMHILQISHKDLTVSSTGGTCKSIVNVLSANISANIHSVKMCTRNDTTVSVDPQTTITLNPVYFRDIGRTGASGFKSYECSWSSTSAWPGSNTDELWKWSSSPTAAQPRRNGTIYCGPQWDGEDRSSGVAWGFVIALNRTDLWPNPEAILTFGTIFAVPKENKFHAITIYFKGGTKGNLESYMATRRVGNNVVKRPIAKFTSACLRYPLCAYVTDDKLREGVPANWQSNTMDYFETTYATTSSPYRSHKDIQLIGEDSSAKYILAKGRTAITKDDCHIFTPPGVVYSGSSATNVFPNAYAPTILDAWISIIPSHHYG